MDRNTIALALVVALLAPWTAAAHAAAQQAGKKRGEILLIESVDDGIPNRRSGTPASRHHEQTGSAYRVKYWYRGRVYTNWVELPDHGGAPLRIRLTPIYF